jgi:hypothetical protein
VARLVLWRIHDAQCAKKRKVFELVLGTSANHSRIEWRSSLRTSIVDSSTHKAILEGDVREDAIRKVSFQYWIRRRRNISRVDGTAMEPRFCGKALEVLVQMVSESHYGVATSFECVSNGVNGSRRILLRRVSTPFPQFRPLILLFSYLKNIIKR